MYVHLLLTSTRGGEGGEGGEGRYLSIYVGMYVGTLLMYLTYLYLRPFKDKYYR